MELWIVPPCPPEFEARLRELPASPELRWLPHGPELLPASVPAASVLLVEAARFLAAAGKPCPLGPPVAVWGPETDAVAALQRGADLWVDCHEAADLLEARLTALARRSDQGRFPAGDPVTGLPEQAPFFRLVEHEFDRARRYRRSLAVLVLQPDQAPRWSRPLADRALGALARSLAGEIREVDTAARLTGDRLAVLFPETDLPGVLAAAERILKSWSSAEPSPVEGQGEELVPGPCSIGVAAIPGRGIDRAVDLLGRALEALLQAQKGGGGGVVPFGAGGIIWSRQAPAPDTL